uniref:F-box domain-containing protein n=1 Tax=Panagrellus redivivus TaxID=6233 RepID=A0A7E4UM42_PANRE
MPFISYENDNLPLLNLPYSFKTRLVQLAPMVEVQKLVELSKTRSDIQSFCRRRPKFYNSVCITDNKEAYNAALKITDPNPLASSYQISQLTRYLYDGPFTFDPKWNSVIHVDDLDKTRPIYIEDTLALCCRDVKDYEKAIPLISGRYKKLLLYGRISWDQVKQLIHANVSLVRIEGIVYVNPSEYDGAVKYINSFCHGFDQKFSFRQHCFSISMINQLKEACERHKTHELVTCNRQTQHLVHKEYRFAYKVDAVLAILPFCSLLLFFVYIHDSHVYNDTPSAFFTTWMGFWGCFLTILFHYHVTAGKLFSDVPLNDYRAFQRVHLP